MAEEDRASLGSHAVLSPSMGAQLLAALGLQGRKVHSLSLNFVAGDITRMDVYEWVPDERGRALLPLLREFVLVERTRPTVAADAPESSADPLPGSPPSAGPAN